jgi:hypothetical protein
MPSPGRELRIPVPQLGHREGYGRGDPAIVERAFKIPCRLSKFGHNGPRERASRPDCF